MMAVLNTAIPRGTSRPQESSHNDTIMLLRSNEEFTPEDSILVVRSMSVGDGKLDNGETPLAQTRIRLSTSRHRLNALDDALILLAHSNDDSGSAIEADGSAVTESREGILDQLILEGRSSDTESRTPFDMKESLIHDASQTRDSPSLESEAEATKPWSDRSVETSDTEESPSIYQLTSNYSLSVDSLSFDHSILAAETPLRVSTLTEATEDASIYEVTSSYSLTIDSLSLDDSLLEIEPPLRLSTMMCACFGS